MSMPGIGPGTVASHGGDRTAGRETIHANAVWRKEGMSPWKHRLVVFTMALSILSFSIFLVTGYTALYRAWLRADPQTAPPYLP